ncbi:MAG: hypothetical protein GWN01_15715 [Nitrosopumilaceae archaeon]|nr:hypothetical protein [Nitrosopumilaceae archaeon]NIU88741.1 hypothetical protein [Nitrosopumilaceae archaeon]NIV66876.1 hypothetical protein [Nitrosopumilaceae archaeon]NIX62890.1 hypothetical protein [Nitrosopumilaceae archaeon]
MTDLVTKQEAYKRFQEEDITKTALAAEYDISPRTLGRWFDAVEDAEDIDEVSEEVTQTICEQAGFTVGSRVRVIAGYNTGEEGVITFDDNDAVPLVELDNGDASFYDIHEYIELIEEEEDEQEPTVDTEDDSEDHFILVPNSVITIVHEGQAHTIDASNVSFNQIVEFCVRGMFEQAVSLAMPAKAITEFTKGDVTVKGETVLYRGEATKDGLADAIIRLMAEGDEGFKKLVAFMNKVKQNPSYKSRHELFGFIKAKDIEITEEGDLICWKKIRHDWTDCYTGTIDNSVGNRVSVPREEVDDDSNRTCSEGLHAAAKSYLSHFRGERVVKVLVNPKDVVSIPTDYNDAKMRTCEYVVLEEVTDSWYKD